MAGGGGGGGERSFEETPTWAIAAVCAVFVIISFIIEHGIQSLGKWFQKRQNKAMIEALEKIKSELMILGFISLLLTISAVHIAKIILPCSIANNWLPCGAHYNYEKLLLSGGIDHGRKLLAFVQETVYLGRVLGENPDDQQKDKPNFCSKKGEKVPLVSSYAMHQLHIFIFLLAVIHVLYSVILMALGYAKMKKWKAWESETSSLEYQFSNDPTRFRLAHQTSFVRRHNGLPRIPGIRWIVAFFRQFFGSISKVDYMTIRHGFISAHFAPNTKFDFHKYIKRSMEDDYKRVIGISIPLWAFVVIFLLFNFAKWHTISALALVPVIIVVVVGTKLELVITEMAEQIEEKTTVVRGAPLVQPTNDFFWFNKPQWILFLIHFTLFQNAYQMAYFLWSWYEFGVKGCLHENLVLIVLRVLLGVGLHILCSYITFPLYALVTQMGSHMKRAIFEEQTATALRKWHKAAKERKKKERTRGGALSPDFTVPKSTELGSPGGPSSPLHLLHNYKYRSSNGAEMESSLPASPMSSYQSDTEFSEMDHPSNQTSSMAMDFSFVKP
ncbi:hypothetical protein M9H77_20212 [Catharanthus roseus]|uniref:Uncharacterized protein n=1 Tax=Catharanthus roseus TaxID=4058 RepID=A0ACC0AJY3_CATRO|nr:hypothetical protein M9H77_20212 [Catharanthus roseus]